MKMQLDGEALEQAVRSQSYNRKLCNCIQAALMASFYGTIGGIYCGWFHNSRKIDSTYCDDSLENHSEVQPYCD